MVQRLRGARLDLEGLELDWAEDDGPARVPWFWLRDHCTCPVCLHPETLQRQVDTFAIAPDARGREVRVDPAGRWLEIVWTDHDGCARYGVELLARPERDAADADRPRRRESWDGGAFAGGLPRAEYDRVMQDDRSLLDYLEAIEHHGLCLVGGCPPTPEATRSLAERVGYVRRTIFGDLWDWSADALLHADTAYTNLSIRPHTDGTYVHDAPGLQLLHCFAFDGTGGDTLLVDGLRVAERLARDHPRAFQVLSTVAVPGHFLEPGVCLRASRPVLRLGRDGEVVQISYNNHDRAPFRLADHEMTAFYDALRAFNALVEDPGLQLRFRLAPGEPLLFDNWRLLHGRAHYEGRRRMSGCYLNREDFESRLRVLRGSASAA